MKRHHLLSVLLFVLFAGVMLSGTVMAGGKCCVSDGICVPCPDKGSCVTATSATTGKTTSCASSCPSGSVSASDSQKKAAVVPATAVSSQPKACAGKACGPCKPGQTCNGKPCTPCKPGECKQSGGKCSTESKGSI